MSFAWLLTGAIVGLILFYILLALTESERITGMARTILAYLFVPVALVAGVLGLLLFGLAAVWFLRQVGIL